jgi:hypothetical protein
MPYDIFMDEVSTCGLVCVVSARAIFCLLKNAAALLIVVIDRLKSLPTVFAAEQEINCTPRELF